MMLHTLLQANPIEGFFFGSGKSMVVGGVAVIILIGIGFWLWRMEKRIQALSRQADDAFQNTKSNAAS